MGRSVHGDDDGAKCAVREGRHGRAQSLARKRPAAKSAWHRASRRLRDRGEVVSRASGCRPAWRGRPGPVRAYSAVPAGRGRTPWRRTAARRRGFGERLGCPSRRSAGEGEGCRSDGCHDEALCFLRGFCRGSAFCGADSEFWPDLLKEGFNCRDLAHTWCRSRIHRGERMENRIPRLPFGARAATSAAANFLQILWFPGIAMARQFVYFMQGLTKTYPHPQGAR